MRAKRKSRAEESRDILVSLIDIEKHLSSSSRELGARIDRLEDIFAQQARILENSIAHRFDGLSQVFPRIDMLEVGIAQRFDESSQLFPRLDTLEIGMSQRFDETAQLFKRIDSLEVGMTQRFEQSMQLFQRFDKLDQSVAHRFEVASEVFSRLDALENAITQRLERLEARGDNVSSLKRMLVDALAAEIDRIDSFLFYYFERTSESIDKQSASNTDPFYSGDNLHIVISDHGFRFVIPTSEIGLIAFVSQHGLFNIEPGVKKIIRDSVSKGGCAIDVGANIGLHAVELSHAVGQSGTLFCYEPLPHIAEALRRTMLINGLSQQTHIEQMAIGDRTGEIDMYIAEHSPLSSVYPLPQGVALHSHKTRMSTLDEMIQAGTIVDLVKIDVEGAEFSVWRGMQRIIRENPHIKIILEWSGSHFTRSGVDPAVFVREIEDNHFEICGINANGSVSVWTPDTYLGDMEGANVLLRRRQDRTNAL